MQIRLAQRLVNTRLLNAQQVAAAQAVTGDDEEALVRRLIGQGLLTRFQVPSMKRTTRVARSA